ncbi:B12-binding domain-containing protein [Methanonatronarchaeum sp. AMET6-2]|uniref:cobalamin B12-binding domain-containing protein n=1 Tax=Methanonatronarchaeum sp. AMET6-2 TaxID=2933293 RepID=UPI001FF40D25|nr:cobalamin-dependent protein [Methanonatronarchaeum sp. AMET6-2]UOY10738.1 cobalamin-dependent protein [Methanonatronarchaeum sp. AMET6-2]
MSDEILAKLKEAVENQDIEMAKEWTQKGIDEGMPVKDIIQDGLAKGMEKVGDQFEKAEVYLPEVMMAADAMEESMELLRPVLEETGEESGQKATVVIATVEGDIHEIGKKVVASMLRGNGYEVIDIGRDVPVDDFVEAVKNNNADVVGASALMSTTMPEQKRIQEAVEPLGVKTIYGGAPVTQEWVDEDVGGDAYAPNAAAAVKAVDEII